MTQQNRTAHWESVYTTKGENEVSWFQDSPAPSLELIDRAGLSASATIIDIGGGASRLVDALLDRGFESLTVLDLSAAALDTAKARLRERSKKVRWIAADVTQWKPDGIYDLWHDRAAFHFLTDAADIAAYITRLEAATAPGSRVIMGTFALDGPEKCSGLVVRRYDSASLAATLGPKFRLSETRRHDHTTPWGSMQRFQFSMFTRV
ncbi:MAG: class I SAM-dependent methyltransferase [Afipia sp.]|nr:class I SAM-dependent methyltransferase [Afipia sp.]